MAPSTPPALVLRRLAAVFTLGFAAFVACWPAAGWSAQDELTRAGTSVPSSRSTLSVQPEKDMNHRTISGTACVLAVASAVWLATGCGGDDDNPAITVASAGANVVSYWDEVAAAVINTPAAPSDSTESERFPNYSADMATLHVALYDTAIAIAGTHQPYKVTPVSPADGASTDAAVNAAAYAVLSGLFPNRAALYQAKYTDAQAAVPDSPAKAQGITLGNEVAAAILADRAGDGRATVLAPFVPGTLPGQFRGVNPVARNQQYIKPFAITSASQFRLPAPSALDSAAYAADVNETMALGSLNSTARSAEQTEAARFHTEPPPRFWTRNLHQFAMSQPSVAGNARLMALLWATQADASIGCFDSKYHHLFWRPISAITLADTDGNAATTADPAWTQVVPTPNHPEYPAAHACVFSSMGEALRAFYGTTNLSFSFDTTVAGISPAGMIHSYTSIKDFSDESIARIWGGMHFRNSVVQGQKLGTQTAQWVTQNHFAAR
jgi:hypothetical protein